MITLSNFVDLVTDGLRRDLSINSIAMSEDGTIFDPHNGQQDIRDKVLRHTSDAFQEDPVRVLRLARFMARFGPEWKVAQETKDLVHTMAKKGVLDELQPERIWKELSRALMEPFPRLFFDTLLECDALHVLFPEVYSLCSAMESIRWHPEKTSYEHVMLVLTQAALNGYDLETRLAALVHDFGKGLTRKEDFPKHYGHDVKGVPIVEKFCNRLTVPAKIRDRAMKATRYHMYCHKLDTINPKTFVHMFMDMGSWNDQETVDVLYRVGVCDERGRLGSENNSLQHLDLLYKVWEKVSAVKFADVFPNGETNPDKIKQGLLKARIVAASEAKNDFNP